MAGLINSRGCPDRPWKVVDGARWVEREDWRDYQQGDVIVTNQGGGRWIDRALFVGRGHSRSLRTPTRWNDVHGAVMGSVASAACWKACVLIGSGCKKWSGHGKAKHAQQKDSQNATHGLIVARDSRLLVVLCRMSASCAAA